MGFKELCELIEKNCVEEIRLQQGMNLSVTLDEHETCELRGNELEKLKKTLLLNASLQTVKIERFSLENLKLLKDFKIKNMRSLSLIQCAITPKNIKFLSTIILGAHELASFVWLPCGYGNMNYDFCIPSGETMRLLSQFITKKQHLRSLALHHCLTEDTIQSAISMISNVKSLIRLNVSHNDFCYAQEILRKAQKTITEFQVSISTNNAKEFSEWLSKNQSIRKLAITKNNGLGKYHDEHAVGNSKVLMETLAKHPTISHLSLFDPELQFDDLLVLMQNKTATSLKIAAAVNGKVDTEKLIVALSKNETLSLTFFDNPELNDLITAYHQWLTAKILKKKWLLAGPLKIVLSFLVNNKETNELATNSYFERVLTNPIQKTIAQNDAILIKGVELKKQQEEASRQRKKI